MTYEAVKNWYEENKQKIVLSVCFVLVFIVGFGAGRFVQPSKSSSTQINYTTNSSKKPFFTPTAAEAGNTQAPAVAGTSTQQSQNCLIKGNISGDKKIYHVPGGAFYNKVKPEQCFNSEAEAQAAGFIKSQR